MFRIVTGPFHPTLEQALVEEVCSLKRTDSFAPLAIIVPSALLADRVKRLLAIDSQLSLLNCHVLTLHQFGLRLRDTSTVRPDPATSLDLVDDFYFEQLVRDIATRQLPSLELLSRLAPSPGTWKALWATVRDLKDAALTPAAALKAVREGLFENEDRPWLETLFTLQAAAGDGSRSLGIGSSDDLLSLLACDLSRYSFLKTLNSVCCYGFYDLLQIQLSFLEAVANCVTTTLYIPLEASAPYTFARRFFERHVLPVSPSHDDRCKAPLAFPEPRRTLSITSVAGSEEELAAVCREILSLVEVHNYRFDDIGVVSRSLEPYQSRIRSVFGRHFVPFTSSAGQPISREPLVKVLSRFASLPIHDFERSAMLDVLSSPLYRVETTDAIEPRPDLWRIAVSTLGITRGKTEWSRLAAVSAVSIIQESSEEPDEDIDCVPSELPDAAQLRLLAKVTDELIRDCTALPMRGSIATLSEAFFGLVRKHLSIPGWTADDDSADDERTLLLTSFVRQALMRLTELEPLYPELSWEEWTELIQLSLEETPFPMEPEVHRGVQILDAMEARGLPFRALFVIGLNEQRFPRFIREDPFLRDSQRHLLSSTLGFAIEEKLAGHDEERLLFELLCRSATHRLYLSYQRADEDGRILLPSALLQTALSDPRFVAAPEVAVPRRLTARVAAQPAIQELLPAQDLALSFLLHKQNAGKILERTGNRSLFENGLAAQEIMERESSSLGPFDGILEVPTATHSLFDAQSMSPTSLERYASCPFRYFAEKWLRLEPVRQTRQDQLPALTFGRLLHDVLRVSYERLTALQWPDAAIDGTTIRQTIAQATQNIFTRYAATQGTGHALLWTLAQEQMVDLVTAVAAEDEQEYRTSGFRPHSFETEATGAVSLGATELKVHGTLDRVDFRQNPPELRIVDYKFKQGREMGPTDGNLLRSALRGWKLQPPLYGSMTVSTLPPPARVQFLYVAPRWKEPIARRIFEMSAFTGRTGDAIKQTIATLIQGIERREFFILPDGYCDYCECTVACRRHDQTAWWRSHRSPQARALRHLRKLKVTDD